MVKFWTVLFSNH